MGTSSYRVKKWIYIKCIYGNVEQWKSITTQIGDYEFKLIIEMVAFDEKDERLIKGKDGAESSGNRL